MPHNRRVHLAVLFCGAVALGLAAPAQAVFPGQNGRIAYAHEGQLYTVEPDGSDVRELVAGANPAFSPDGSSLVYSCEGQVCVINADGSGAQQVTTDPTLRSQQPNWAPSGTRIVFTRRDVVDASGGPARLYVIDPDGTEERSLEEDGNDPVWSSDGRRIAFTKGNQGDGIHLIRPDGSGVKRIYKADGYVHSLSWSPDARRIAFTLQRRNFWKIWVVRRDGRAAREIFRGSGHRGGGSEVSGRGLSWSPNGNRIAYYNIKKDRLCFVRPTGRRAGCLDRSGERPDWGTRTP